MFIDLTGIKYGKWTVLKFSHKNKYNKSYWKCKCECGREFTVGTGALRSGKSKSCIHCANSHIGKRKSTNEYIIHEDYMECIIDNGDSFIFDKEDFDIINKYNWCIDKNKTVVSGSYCFNGALKKIHTLITECQKPNVVDHINNNRCDNRKANLRVCTQHQNSMNCATPINNTSGYKGVSWSKRKNKWRAYIKYNYKQIYLGLYNNKTDAAKAYNEAAIKYFGEFAHLNNI